MYVYVCMYVCMYMHVCMYMYVCTYICLGQFGCSVLVLILKVWVLSLFWPKKNSVPLFSEAVFLPGGFVVKNHTAVKEAWVWSLGQEEPLEEEMAATPVFSPGKSHGQRSLAGYSPWGLTESDTTEYTHPLPWDSLQDPLSSLKLKTLNWISTLLVFSEISKLPSASSHISNIKSWHFCLRNGS